MGKRETSHFLGKKVKLYLYGEASPLEGMILKIIKEPGEQYLYEIQGDKKAYFLAVNDVSMVEVCEEPKLKAVVSL